MKFINIYIKQICNFKWTIKLNRLNSFALFNSIKKKFYFFAKEFFSLYKYLGIPISFIYLMKYINEQINNIIHIPYAIYIFFFIYQSNNNNITQI